MNKQFGIVYIAKNKINNKCYVGITTTTLEKRIAEHYSHFKSKHTKFYKAIRKYGKENFVWDTLVKDIPVTDLNWYELWFISTLDTKVNGYNTKDELTVYMSEEKRLKVNQDKKDRYLKARSLFVCPVCNKYIYIKKSSINTMKTCSMECNKENRRRKLLGKKFPERGEKISKALTGKPKSKEHRQNLSDSRKAKQIHLTDAQKQHLRQIFTGRIVSEETKKKISKSRIGIVPWNKGLKKSEWSKT